MVNIAHRLSMFHQNNSFKHTIDIFENNLSFPLVYIYCAYHLFVFVQSSSFPLSFLDGRYDFKKENK